MDASQTNTKTEKKQRTDTSVGAVAVAGADVGTGTLTRTRNRSFDRLPDTLTRHAIQFCTFFEIARLRSVSKDFNRVTDRLLQQSFVQVWAYHKKKNFWGEFRYTKPAKDPMTPENCVRVFIPRTIFQSLPYCSIGRAMFAIRGNDFMRDEVTFEPGDVSHNNRPVTLQPDIEPLNRYDFDPLHLHLFYLYHQRAKCDECFMDCDRYCGMIVTGV